MIIEIIECVCSIITTFEIVVSIIIWKYNYNDFTSKKEIKKIIKTFKKELKYGVEGCFQKFQTSLIKITSLLNSNLVIKEIEKELRKQRSRKNATFKNQLLESLFNLIIFQYQEYNKGKIKL